MAVAGLAVPAVAQEPDGTLKKVRDTKAFTVGHHFAYYDQNNKPAGFAIELCQRDHAEEMLVIESSRTDAYLKDEVILYGRHAKSAQKDRFEVVGRLLSF